MSDQVLKVLKQTIGRKEFTVERCSNVRGQFLRVRENPVDTSRRFGKPNSVIVPAEGLTQFIQLIGEVMD